MLDSRAAVEPEIENARRAILEDLVYDLNDGYQRSQAEAVMPWLSASRMDVVSKQVEQFSFLTKLQTKSKLESTGELVRILMILGGRERMIFMNNVVMAVSSTGTPSQTLWGGLVGAAGMSTRINDPRFLMGYNDDAWFVAAGTENSAVRKMLVELAVAYLHLFPKMVKGATNIMSKTPASGRGLSSRGAEELVKQAHQFCITADPAQWLKKAFGDIKTGKEDPAPKYFGGPRQF